MSHARTALNFLRRMHATDLVLPIGAALVTSGLQILADRETRQRERLAALQRSVSDHLDALNAAGVTVPDELAVDELHPFDNGAALGIAPDPSPAPASSSSTRRGWKLLALGAGLAAGVTLWGNRGRIFDAAAPFVQGWHDAGVNRDLHTLNHSGSDRWTGGDLKYDDSPVWTGDRCEECGQPAAWFVDDQLWRHVVPPNGLPRWSSHEVKLPAAVNESNLPPAPADDECVGAPECGHESVKHDLTPGPAPADVDAGDLVAEQLVDEPAGAEPADLGNECGWSGCTWKPRDTTRGAARVTALAVHRAKCPHRPPSMTVPEH